MDEQQSNEEQQGEILPEHSEPEQTPEQATVEAPPELHVYEPAAQIDQNTEFVEEQPSEQVEQPAPDFQESSPIPDSTADTPPPEQQDAFVAPMPIFVPPPQEVQQPAPPSSLDRVSNLTDEELEAAHRLWQSKKIRDYQKLSVAARKNRQQAALDKILRYVQQNSPAKIPRMANDMVMSPRLVAHYLQKLVKSGQVRAEGWSKGRKYFA